MGFLRSIFKCGSILAVLVAVIVGCFIAGVPRQAGLYKWLAHRDPDSPIMIGMAPAFHDGIEWRFTWEEMSAVDLTGQTALVTGANAGVGYAMSVELARQGAAVVLACRNPKKCDKAASAISAETKNTQVTTMTMDTSSLASVRAFAAAFAPEALDMLYLNAGIGSAGRTETGGAPLSEDGIEMVFATNHVGHHLLYKLLAPKLLKAPAARIVLTSSCANYQSYEYGVATDLATLNGHAPDGLLYGQSKLAQILFAQELTRQLGPESTIFVNSFHPGAAASEIWDKNPMIPEVIQPLFRKLQSDFMWNCRDGSLTGLYLGLAHEKNVRGRYFQPQSYEVQPNKVATKELGEALWAFSESLVA